MDEEFYEINDLFERIQYCKEKKHFQQVVYSVHKLRLTQICFDCKKVRHN